MTITVEVEIKENSKNKVKEMANAVRNTMITLAKSNLSSKSSFIYANALTKVTVSGNTARFMLKGWLANAIESGCDPFDMKPGLLSSSKVKISKKGNPYLRVPVADSPLIVRTVSSNSKPGTWIHPGIIPRDFFDKAIYNLRYLK